VKNQQHSQSAFSDDSLGLNPDFVVCGGPTANGWVRLFASKDLTRAELDVVEDYEDIDISWYRVEMLPRRTHRTITLSTVLKHLIIIEAPDYKTAWESLFKDWSPERAAKPAITKGQPQLEA
jgi:hypothetical protein